MAIKKQEYSLKENKANGLGIQEFDAAFREFGAPVFENEAVHAKFIDLIYNHIKPDSVIFIKHRFTNDTQDTYSLYSDGVLLARFRNGKLVKLSLPGVKTLDGDNYFLSTSGASDITYASFPDLVSVGKGFMGYAYALKFMSTPKLEKTDESFAHSCDELETFFGPKLKRMGDYSFSNAERVRIFYTPKLTNPGVYCLHHNDTMRSISLRSMKRLPAYFMYANTTLKGKNIEAPNLEEVLPTCGTVFVYVAAANKAHKHK